MAGQVLRRGWAIMTQSLLGDNDAKDHQAGEQPVPEQHRPGIEMNKPGEEAR
jgi:hypothetical protein